VTLVLRREARYPQKRLTVPLAVAATGLATIAGTLALYVAVAPSPDVVVLETQRMIPMPVFAPRIVVVPAPGLARLGARLDRAAASSVAPVIAVASKDRVWISRDDGATFAPALDHAGEVTDLFVDADGTVYANRDGVLGVARARDERWSELPHLDGRLLDAVTLPSGAVMVVAEQWGVGTVAAQAGDAGYHTLVGGDQWNALAAALSPSADARLLVSERTAEHAWSAPELHVGDRVAWRGRYDDAVGYLRASTPCAGLAGDALWIVQRDPMPLSTTTLPSRLLAVGADGHEHTVVLANVDLEAARVTCSIVGSPRAAYASFQIDGQAPRLFLLDAVAHHATPLDGGDTFDLRAVDHAGRALGLDDGALVRRGADGAFTTLARR
jgi:hypothetical protein